MRILVVTSRWPWPARRGDQLRAHQLLAALTEDHEVTLLAPATAGLPPPVPLAGSERYRPDPPPRHALAALRALGRGEPIQQSLFAAADLDRRCARLAPAADLVVLQLVRLAPCLRHLAGRPLLVDFIDCLSQNMERRAALDRLLWAPLLRAEARRLARAERRLLAASGCGVVVAERDRAALAALAGPELARRLEVIPLAVPPGPPPAPVTGGGQRLVLTGNLGYYPTREAALWFLDEVWPAVRAAHPDAELLLAGDRPPAVLRRAAGRAGARLSASPASLAEVFHGATLALAPMRAGSGVPVKVLEAWAAGVPVVASPEAAAGTTARPGEELAVAGSAAEWVTVIGRLLADPVARTRLAASGRARLVLDHAPAAVTAAWRRAVEQAARTD
ncbi:MAG TPA: glycosyltransferase family 4 protein [Thermoanaerobaculia bacterium]|nr:glycosyltransferase family 4 protein [Thermoanaerobaculia bacterium]